ncbi:class I SAM-dependent methyltransferase [Thermodesulfobacteriota bacterium]
MNKPGVNRFQDFFEETTYLDLKNYLYNYRIRKKAVEKALTGSRPTLILELGSGISPVLTGQREIIYADLSLTALQFLRNSIGNGWYVVANAENLPFKPVVFSHAVCSEVLEHVRNDHQAIAEISRILKVGGCLVVTFPHRRIYFTNDDRFVNHYRRYEHWEMESRLKKAGLSPLFTRKILGPLEKLTMSLSVFIFSKKRQRSTPRSRSNRLKMAFITIFKWLNRLYMGIVWLDARVMPASLSTVLLIKAEKKHVVVDR